MGQGDCRGQHQAAVTATPIRYSITFVRRMAAMTLRHVGAVPMHVPYPLSGNPDIEPTSPPHVLGCPPSVKQAQTPRLKRGIIGPLHE
jgi:hypothetical protein